MLGKTFLLEYISSLILIQLFQTSNASHNHPCIPSACGRIPNISHPFRLRGDPKHCGDSRYELVCQNNISSLYLYSYQYNVHAINYNNLTIHLVDAAFEKDNSSFPQHSLPKYPFIRDNQPIGSGAIYSTDYPDRIYSRQLDRLTTSVTFVSCPYPMNSSLFLETAHCDKTVCASNDSHSSTRYSYVTVGDLDVLDVKDMCRVDIEVMTS